MKHTFEFVVSIAVAASLLACTATTTTTGGIDPQASEPPAAEPPVTSPSPGPSPMVPPKANPLTPPTVKVDPGFAGGAGIIDGVHSIYAAAPGAGGVTYVALRKAGGSLGWGNGTLVRRYLASGALDVSFAATGELDTKLVANPLALAVDPSGNILVGGVGLYDPDSTTDTGREVVVVRVTSAGAVDATYGVSGRAKLSFSPVNVSTSALHVRSDGSALVSVSGRTDGKESFGSFLVGPLGRAVPGYGTGGFAPSTFPTDGALALNTDVAVPTSDGPARFGADGAQKGYAIEAAVFMAKAAPDGSLVAVLTRDGKTFGIERFSAAGIRDASFAPTPVTDRLTDFQPASNGAVFVAEGADLKWVSNAGGASTLVVPRADVARLAATSDGKLLALSTSGAAVRRYTY